MPKTRSAAPGRPSDMVITDPSVLATLYDPLRYRVFGALRTPRSIPEVAERLGVPANGLYYHVRRLLEAGLIVQVGARTSGKHTERLYGHTAERLTLRGDVRMEEAGPAVAAILKDAFEELDGALRAHETGAIGDDEPTMLAWHTAPMTEARARAFERRLEALVAEFTKPGKRASTSTKRYALLGVFTPLPDEAKR